jgi:ABC-type transporter Mla subunit MlaD
MDAEDIVQNSVKKPGQHLWLSRVPFLLAVFGGIAILLALKHYEYNQFLVSGVAAALLIIYVVCVYFTPVLRIREDQLGDNAYYVGFCYTLTSLGWALYVFSKGNDEAEIVANFGIALISTLVGIVARVTLNQLRRDVVETERDARMALSEAVVRMRGQLDEATGMLRAFCIRAEQITNDALHANVEKTNEVIEKSVQQLATTSNSVLERIEEAFKEFSDNSKKLNDVSKGSVKAIEALVNKIEKIEAPVDLVVKRMEPVLKASEVAGQALRDRVEADVAAFDRSSSRMAEIESQFRQTADVLSAAGKNLSYVVEISSSAARAAEGAAKGIEVFTSAAAQTIGEHEKVSAEAQQSAAKMLNTIANEQRRVTEEARSSLNQLTDALKSHNTELAKELDRSRRMTSQIGEAFAEMADSLSEKVEAENKRLDDKHLGVSEVDIPPISPIETPHPERDNATSSLGMA